MCNTVLYTRYNISTIFHKKNLFFLYDKFPDNPLKSPNLNNKEAIQSIDWIASLLLTYVFYFYIELLHFFI